MMEHSLKRFPEYREYHRAVTSQDPSLIEASLIRIVERARSEGTREELHSTLYALFSFRCRQRDRNAAVAVINELEADAPDGVGVPIARLFAEFGDAALTEEYVDRYLLASGWSRSLPSSFRNTLSLLVLKLRLQVANGSSRETIDETVIDLALASMGQACWFPELVDALRDLLERDELHPIAVPIFTALWCGLSRLAHVRGTDHSVMLQALDEMSNRLQKRSKRGAVPDDEQAVSPG